MTTIARELCLQHCTCSPKDHGRWGHAEATGWQRGRRESGGDGSVTPLANERQADGKSNGKVRFRWQSRWRRAASMATGMACATMHDGVKVDFWKRHLFYKKTVENAFISAHPYGP